MAARRTATRTPRTPARTHPCAHRPGSPSDLLGRAVIQRPHEVRRSRSGWPTTPRPWSARNPTGTHDRAAGPRIDQHVGRLDVPVHQPGGVRGIQGRGHRGDDRGRAGRRQRAQLGAPASRTSPPGTYRMAMNSTPSASPASNTGMMCGSSTAAADRDSRMKRCRNSSSVGQRGREDLERYLPVKPLVLGAEYHRHPALADLLLQAVPGDPRTGGEAGEKPDGSGPSSPIAPPGHASPPFLAVEPVSDGRVTSQHLATGASGASGTRS